MCTTYLGYRIAVAMRARGDEIAPYPRLIRLNPNVPWRTRGNGAVGITVLTRDAVGARREIEEMVRRHSETANGANPGLAFLESGSVPDALSEFAREALWRVIPRERAARLAGTLGLESHSLGNGQGLVGALGAIGSRLGDFTMELLAYRSEGLVGTPRRIEAESVRELHERTFPSTFNSYDAARGRALIAPHGPDPVLYGIRGEDARSVIDASAHVRGERPVAQRGDDRGPARRAPLARGQPNVRAVSQEDEVRRRRPGVQVRALRRVVAAQGSRTPSVCVLVVGDVYMRCKISYDTGSSLPLVKENEI